MQIRCGQRNGFCGILSLQNFPKMLLSPPTLNVFKTSAHIVISSHPLFIQLKFCHLSFGTLYSYSSSYEMTALDRSCASSIILAPITPTVVVFETISIYVNYYYYYYGHQIPGKPIIFHLST